MKLSEYFDKAKGIGILATADAEGHVNMALYARPHFMDDQTATFIMSDRLSHSNLQSNPHAAYLFKEDGSYEGKRLHMTKIREEENSETIEKIRRRKYTKPLDDEIRFLVHFRIDRILPLIGTTESSQAEE